MNTIADWATTPAEFENANLFETDTIACSAKKRYFKLVQELLFEADGQF